jgi:3-dehydroquinate dehydratase/shikimate dehydrogenase
MLIVSLQNPHLFSEHLKKKGADAVELRVDLCLDCSIESLTDFRNKLNLPLIITLKANQLEAQLHLISTLNPDYIDIDFSLFPLLIDQIKAKHPRAKIIVSKHTKNFYETETFFKKFQKADFKKLVIETEDPFIGLKTAVLAKKHERILFASGLNTQFSRLFGKWQYCYLKEPTGKGQFSLDDLHRFYHWKKPLLQFYALIGNPIDHSPSHITHNLILDYHNKNIRYIKIPVFSKNLEKTINLLKQIGCLGLSITTPLKKSVPKKYTNKSLQTSFNTLCFNKNKAINTDVEALKDFLMANGIQEVLILGNGACASAFKMALSHSRITLQTWSRKLGFSLKKPQHVECIINATSSQDPLEDLPSFKFLINLYHKQKDPMIEQRALNQKAIILKGCEFFQNQAIKQFEFWGFKIQEFPSF